MIRGEDLRYLDSATKVTTTSPFTISNPFPSQRPLPMIEMQRAGLGLMVTLLRIYGLRMDPCTTFNYATVTCIMLLSLVGVASGAMLLVTQMNSDRGVDTEFVCMWVVITFYSMKTPIMYVHACLLFRKYAIFLVQLARTVNAIAVEGHRSPARKLARMTTVAAIVVLILTLAGAASSVICFPVQEEELPEHFRLYVLDYSITLLSMKSILLCWFLFANSFTYTCTAMLIVICQIIKKCFDNLIPENRRDEFDKNFLLSDSGDGLPVTDQMVSTGPASLPSARPQMTIGHRQIWHERLCTLVAEANHLFAPFMLLSLGGEITVLILYSQSGNVLNWLHGLVLSVVQSVMFLLTTIQCAAVNEKVISSLMLSPLHRIEDIKSYSGEHINYMLYASQLAVQGVTMTYGMFFPIRYSFIFTIAGTTLTYTLIFKDFV